MAGRRARLQRSGRAPRRDHCRPGGQAARDWPARTGTCGPGAAGCRDTRRRGGAVPVLGPGHRGGAHPPATARRLVVPQGKAGTGRARPHCRRPRGDRGDGHPPGARAARERLTYAHDGKLLDRLVSPGGGDGEDPGDTVPCVLLRHASAGRKSSWRGDDLLRPLDERGQADAQTLAELLACYAPQRVISSAAERCLGTVRPYAERIGAAIEVEPAFTAPSANDDGDRSAAAKQRMTELIARPSPMAICAHGENLPVLLEQALAVLDSTRPAGEWTPPKAGFWVLHVHGAHLSALERHTVTS